ncbi:tetraspanin-7-like isoform X1 [Styela clava]
MERFLTRIFTSLCFMFAVTGILVFAFGIFFEVKYGHVIGRVSLDDTGIATPKNVFAASSAISISVGLIIFFVSLCGWHGARDGNICMLKIFKFVLFAVIILYFVLTILTIVAASSLEMTIMQSVEFMFSTYNSNKEPIDHIQQYGECCGVKSYLDWSKNENWVNTVSQLSLNSSMVLPSSCCVELPKDSEQLCETSSVFYENGCGYKIWFIINDNSKFIKAFGIFFTITLIIGIAITNKQLKKIHDGEMDSIEEIPQNRTP